MRHSRGSTAMKALGLARAMMMLALVGAVLAQSGACGLWDSEKAHAQTATSEDLVYRFAKVAQYNNGVHTYNLTESVMGVNGEIAFCMDPFSPFEAGTVQSADILSVVSQDQLTNLALRAHYIRDVYQDSPLSANARVILAQTAIWEVLTSRATFMVVAAESGGTFPELTASVRDDVLAKARQFAAENATRYQGHGILWLNGCTQPIATLGCELAVGTIELSKRSANPSISDANGCYALEGATYGVFSDPDCVTEVCRLSTDARGYAKSGELRVGTYYVREQSAPKGFAVDRTVRAVSVTAGKTASVGGDAVYDVPLTRDGIASIDKHDAEIGWRPIPTGALGAATLASATYTVAHYGGIFDSPQAAAASGAPLATWEFATDEQGRIDLSRPDDCLRSGTLYRDADGRAVFPLGTYVIRESAPSAGYLLSSEAIALRVGQSGEIARLEGAVEGDDGRWYVPSAEQVKRCDLSLTKVRESDMTRLAGIPFALVSETTGEAHVLVTDENGRIDTSSGWNPHTDGTNASDEALDEDGKVDEGKLDASAGIWFGLSPDGTMTQAQDSLGALPYDTYTLEELPCSANAGLVLVKMEGIIAKRDSVTVDLGTIDDKEAGLPTIATVAYDALDRDKRVSADPDALVRDEVELGDLVPGRAYALYGAIIDTETGLPALQRTAQDDGAGPERASDSEDAREEGARRFWDGLVELLGAKQVPSLGGYSYEIGTEGKANPAVIDEYLSENEALFSRMIVASRAFEAEAPTMVTSLDYEMDATEMEGDYVIYDLLVGEDGTLAIHADTANEQESFVVEQPSPEPTGKGYYKTGFGMEAPLGASGMMVAGSAIGAALFAGRRFREGWTHAR